jgi:hypothetical protein
MGGPYDVAVVYTGQPSQTTCMVVSR